MIKKHEIIMALSDWGLSPVESERAVESKASFDLALGDICDKVHNDRRQLVKNQIMNMLQEIAQKNTIEEIRAVGLHKSHAWEDHQRHDLRLSPETSADLVFTLGVGSQIGVLLGVLHRMNELPKDLDEKAIKVLQKEYPECAVHVQHKLWLKNKQGENK